MFKDKDRKRGDINTLLFSFDAVRHRVIKALTDYWIIAGIVLSTSSFFWATSGTATKTIFYLTLLLPGFLLLALNGFHIVRTSMNLIPFRLLALMICWLLLSMLWSPVGWQHENAKYAFFIALFLVSLAFADHQPQRLRCAFLVASCFVAIGFSARIAHFYWIQPHPITERLWTTGIAGNPLRAGALAAFAAIILSHDLLFYARSWLLKTLMSACVLALVVFLLLGQARSVVAAFVVGAAFMVFASGSRFRWLSLIVLLAASALTYWALESMFLTRGISFRPQVWLRVIEELNGGWWFGKGLGQTFSLEIVPEVFVCDVHSYYLIPLYNGGVIGFVLWLAFVIKLEIDRRKITDIKIRSLIVGLLGFCLVYWIPNGAHMINRPNEAWYGFWFPIAIMLWALTNDQQRRKGKT